MRLYDTQWKFSSMVSKTVILNLVIVSLLGLAEIRAQELNPGPPDRAYLFDEGRGTEAAPRYEGVIGSVGSLMNWRPGAFGYEGDFCVSNIHRPLGAPLGHVRLDEEYVISGSGTISLWIQLNPAVNGDAFWGAHQGEVILSAFPGADEMKINRAGFFNMPTGEQATFSAHMGGSTWYTPSNYIGGTPPRNYPAPGGNNTPYRGWHHLVYVYSEDSTGGLSNWLYWDGELMRLPGAAVPPAGDWTRTWSAPLIYNGIALGGDVSSNPWGHVTDWGGSIDEFAFYQHALSPGEVLWLARNSIRDLIIPAGGPFGLQVRRDEVGMLEVSWNSKEGELYNLRSVTGLSTEPLTWAIFDGNDNLAATPPRNTLTFSYPADPERFFAIEGFPKPPVRVVVIEDNFDGRIDLPPWTNSSPEGNAWELGVPTAGFGPLSAFSPPNAVGTVLAGNYIASNDVGKFVVSSLRSPAIPLSGIASGTISYQRYVDMEDPQFDFATVNLLDAADDSLIEVLETDIGNGSLDWEGVSHDIPAAAIGKTVYFQIVFSSDYFDSLQTGLVIDDFKVEGFGP